MMNEDELQMYSRGVDKIVEGIAALHREVPVDEPTRIAVSAQSMTTSFSYDNLAVMLAIAVDRLAMQKTRLDMQKVSDPKGGWPT